MKNACSSPKSLLAQAAFDEKSPNSVRESHVIASYFEDLQRKTGQFDATRCRVMTWSEIPQESINELNGYHSSLKCE